MMTHASLIALLLAACGGGAPLAVHVAAQQREPSEPEPTLVAETRVLYVHGFAFATPPWWDEVDAVLPEEVLGDAAVRDYIRARCGSDTGTHTTWRRALRLWVQHYLREDGLPVYIAHAYRAGGRHAEAASAFAALHGLAAREGDDASWYDVYLSYNAGVSHREAGDEAEARRYFEIAARHLDASDDAEAYYAAEAQRRLEE